MRESFAITKWTIDDVLVLRPDWTKVKAAKFLEENEDELEEAMVQEGWGIIYHRLEVDGINVV